MKIRRLLLIAFGLVLAALSARAENEIGFIEKFALATDREAVLGQLIPGSEDFYFYSALHYQSTQQKEKFGAIMSQWAKRFPDSQPRRVIENRAALLNYEADPQATLKFLRERLNLQFNHQQEARDKKPDLPSVLDQARIARSVFQGEALRNGDDLHECSEAALETLVREKVALKRGAGPRPVGALEAARCAEPPDLIAADLKSKESSGFGEFEIQRALLPEQLDDLAKRVPSLADNRRLSSRGCANSRRARTPMRSSIRWSARPGSTARGRMRASFRRRSIRSRPTCFTRASSTIAAVAFTMRRASSITSNSPAPPAT